MHRLGLVALIRVKSREKFRFCQLEVHSRQRIGDGKYC